MTARCVIVRSIGFPFDSGPNVMTSSLIRERPGVAGKGIWMSSSLPPVAAKRVKISVGMRRSHRGTVAHRLEGDDGLLQRRGRTVTEAQQPPERFTPVGASGTKRDPGLAQPLGPHAEAVRSRAWTGSRRPCRSRRRPGSARRGSRPRRRAGRSRRASSRGPWNPYRLSYDPMPFRAGRGSATSVWAGGLEPDHFLAGVL